MKTKPDKVVGHLVKKALTCDDYWEILSIAGDYKNKDDFKYAIDVTPKINLIKKPFFFLNALDDPFWGSEVIPIDHSSK